MRLRMVDFYFTVVLSAMSVGGLSAVKDDLSQRGGSLKTDYRCEGENMTLSCADSVTPGVHGIIGVIRANFGRFSLSICNQQRQVSWNVNCMEPKTIEILRRRCNGKLNCVVPVDTNTFQDACPGTFKYLEVHYACLNPHSQASTYQAHSFEVEPSSNLFLTSKSRHSWSINPAKDPLGEPKFPREGKLKPSHLTRHLEHNHIASTSSPASQRVPITTPRSTSTTTATSSVAIETSTKPVESMDSTTTPTLITEDSNFTIPIVKNNTRRKTVLVNEAEAAVPVNLSPLSSCPPVTARKLQWDRTPIGDLSIQPCPIGATGLAKWTCVDSEGPQWQGAQPDMGDCKSVAMSNLEVQAQKDDPEDVLISSLAYVTRTKALYGGDLESTVAIMRAVSSRIRFRFQSSTFRDRESHVRQATQSLLQSASNVLEISNRPAWMDLSLERRMKAATSLVKELQDMAFLLARVIRQPTNILETYEILTMSIANIEVDLSDHLAVGTLPERIRFPDRPLLYVDDAVDLSSEDAEAHGKEGVAEAVFFSFTTLHEILEAGRKKVDGDTWRLNSRILTASLAGKQLLQLKNPVRIFLRHLVIQDMTNPICVHWDSKHHIWSDEGCQLALTNSTMTVCECQHLGIFSVLMRPRSDTFDKGSDEYMRLDIIVGVTAAAICVTLVGILLKFTRGLYWKGRFCLCGVRGNNNSRLTSCQTGYLQKTNDDLVTSASNYGSKLKLFGNRSNKNQYSLPSQYSSVTPQTPLNRPPLEGSSHKATRTHITLNPYSTQLVENLNLLMPGKNAPINSSTLASNPDQRGPMMVNVNPRLVNLTNSLRKATNPAPFNAQSTLPKGFEVESSMTSPSEVIYRAVSPHGHVYWEIGPTTQNISSHGYLHSCIPEEESFQDTPQDACLRAEQFHHGTMRPDIRPFLLTSGHFQGRAQSQQCLSLDNLQGEQAQFLATQSPFFMSPSSSHNTLNNTVFVNGTIRNQSFVRTGANRFHRNGPIQPQPDQMFPNSQFGNPGGILEQLQTQVQVKDIRPIQVSVKSSEYIQAKIRTLRRNEGLIDPS